MRYSLDELKKQKYFYPKDIIAYVLIAVTVITLLCVFLIPGNNKALDKINIYYDGGLIYVYTFEDKKGEKTGGYDAYITEYNENGLTFVRINTKEGENVVEIGASYAKMAEADCSSFADCVTSFRPITQGGDIIICLPHKITVVGEGEVLGNGVRL